MIEIRLSICIATLNRGAFIGGTLDSILSQLPPNTEIIILDGASKDSTPQVMEAYAHQNPQIRYFREAKNSGVDADFDKAVGYASGKYCWLMTDDDLLAPGAIDRVLLATTSDPDLIVVNSELKSADFSIQFSKSTMKSHGRSNYGPEDQEIFFSQCCNYLSYIGGVVIKRKIWLARAREPYYGSLFIHVGVIFQSPPLKHVELIIEPLITIRYGNAMWTPRRFEIWMFMWPNLIWSFSEYSSQEKLSVTPAAPWKSTQNILLYKAIGGFGPKEYRKFIAPKTSGFSRLLYKSLAFAPASIVSFFAIVYCVAKSGRVSPELYDISLSQNTGVFGQWLARKILRIPS